MFKIIQRRKIWLGLSSILVVLSIISLGIWGLNFGIDFTGGSLLEVKFSNYQPNVGELQENLREVGLSSLTIQPAENNTAIFRFQDSTETVHQEIIRTLKSMPLPEGIESNEIEELRFNSVGPSIGQELKRKSVSAIIIVILVIILYISIVFQKVSKPVASWKYGLTAIVALFHDVIITLGIFSILGHFYGVEINTAFVAAILTVLGYSVNDTIIVFDRVRENLPKSDDTFENTVNLSVNQTITRSVNTSTTTLLVLLSILFFGGETIRSFILALSIGVVVGTYSSIFIASPLLVIWDKLKKS